MIMWSPSILGYWKMGKLSRDAIGEGRHDISISVGCHIVRCCHTLWQIHKGRKRKKMKPSLLIFLCLSVIFISKPIGRLDIEDYKKAMENCTVRSDTKDAIIFFCEEDK